MIKNWYNQNIKKKTICPQKKRIWEIDVIRALAVIGMVYFHFLFVLNYLNIHNFQLFEGPLEILGNIVRNGFFMVVGIGMVISLQRYQSNKKPLTGYYKKEIRKATSLILLGGVITVLSLIFTPEKVVRFGVLSFIGTTIILLLPLARSFWLLSILTIGVLLIEHNYGKTLQIESLLGYIIGFYPRYWPSLDYFPIIPWCASISGGGVLAYLFFKDGDRRYPFFQKPFFFLKPFVWIGQKALLIYLTHLPIILLIALAIDKTGIM